MHGAGRRLRRLPVCAPRGVALRVRRELGSMHDHPLHAADRLLVRWRVRVAASIRVAGTLLEASETARGNVTPVDGYNLVPMISGKVSGSDAVLGEARAPRIRPRAHAMHRCAVSERRCVPLCRSC